MMSKKERQRKFRKFYALFLNTTQKQMFLKGLACFGCAIFLLYIAFKLPSLLHSNSNFDEFEAPISAIPAANNGDKWSWNMGIAGQIRSFFGLDSERGKHWRCGNDDEHVTLLLDFARKIKIEIR